MPVISVSQGDEVDVASAQYLVNSSLAGCSQGSSAARFLSGHVGCAASVLECCLSSGSMRASALLRALGALDSSLICMASKSGI